MHCKTDDYQTVLTNAPMLKTGLGSLFQVLITNTGKDDVIALGLCEKNYPANKLPGWKPLSVGYHGDDGGIFVESTKMTYYTNETFKEAIIGVMVETQEEGVTFTKRTASVHDLSKKSCMITIEPHIVNEELYPCVGFHSAKDVSVRISNFIGKRSLNDHFEDDHKPLGSCPFTELRF